jgi:hypothetical protein
VETTWARQITFGQSHYVALPRPFLCNSNGTKRAIVFLDNYRNQMTNVRYYSCFSRLHRECGAGDTQGRMARETRSGPNASANKRMECPSNFTDRSK